MQRRLVGLWMPDATRDSSDDVTHQARALAVQLGQVETAPDLVVTPETWLRSKLLGFDCPPEQAGPLAVEWLQAQGVPDDQRCLVGVALGPFAPKGGGAPGGRYILVDTARPDRPYIKHSTAGHTAWEEPDWSPQQYLPTWRGGIRPSLCQDIYFPLLAASRHSGREVRLIVNAAGGNLGVKRRRLLVATAIENQCPIVSTWQNTGNEEPCAVDAHGGRLPLDEVDRRAKSKLFLVDLAATSVPEAFKDVRGTGARDSSKIRFKHGVPHLPGTNVTVVRLDSRVLRDPRRWVGPELHERACMFHLKVPVARADEARRIAEARATQLGTPTVLEYGDTRLVIERATKRKDVRVNDATMVRREMIASRDSVYRELVGHAPGGSRAAARRARVEQYATLLRDE